MAMQSAVIALVLTLVIAPAAGQDGRAAAPVARQQQPPFDQLSDPKILAVFGRNAEEQRQVLWSGAQAFCRVHPDDRMCTRPQ
jgi:hypothetical protein